LERERERERGGGGVGLATLHVSALGGAEVTESGRRSSTRSAGR